MGFVGDSLDRLARDAPGQPALVCGSLHLTRRAFLNRVRAAGALVASRAPQGGRVALTLTDPAALLIAFLACARQRRVALVLDPAWPGTHRAKVLAAVAPDAEIGDQLSAQILQGDAAAARPAPSRPPAAGDLFYAGFTSGSSGVPKGYVRSHGSWLKSFKVTLQEFGLAPDSRIVIPGQLSHSLHLYGAVCGAVSGQEVVLMPRFDPRAILTALRGAKSGSVLYATPTQLHFLGEAARRSGPVTGLRQVLASGAKWLDEDRKTLRQLFPNAALYEFYGASETSFITLSSSHEPVPEGSVGRAAKGVEIAIGNPSAPNPPDSPGAIWVKSGLLFSGYLCGTAPDTRWQDGWLTVGDHGALDRNGYLRLTGRASRMIVTSGLNVYPEEIEAVLGAHPAVAVALVTGISDPVRGERIEALVELRQDLPAPERQLLAHCRIQLAKGKLPRKIHIRQHLPLTPGGKPDIQRIVSSLELET